VPPSLRRRGNVSKGFPVDPIHRDHGKVSTSSGGPCKCFPAAHMRTPIPPTWQPLKTPRKNVSTSQWRARNRPSLSDVETFPKRFPRCCCARAPPSDVETFIDVATFSKGCHVARICASPRNPARVATFSTPEKVSTVAGWRGRPGDSGEVSTSPTAAATWQPF
jgi:hypothetical protein